MSDFTGWRTWHSGAYTKVAKFLLKAAIEELFMDTYHFCIFDKESSRCLALERFGMPDPRDYASSFSGCRLVGRRFPLMSNDFVQFGPDGESIVNYTLAFSEKNEDWDGSFPVKQIAAKLLEVVKKDHRQEFELRCLGLSRRALSRHAKTLSDALLGKLVSAESARETLGVPLDPIKQALFKAKIDDFTDYVSEPKGMVGQGATPRRARNGAPKEKSWSEAFEKLMSATGLLN